MIILETERLLLRPWRPEDFEAFATYLEDERWAKFIGGPCGRNEAWRRFAAIVGRWTLRGYGFWALEEKQTGDFVGSAGLWFPEGWPELEVGYWLMPEKHGRGYATEAAAKSRSYAFQVMKQETLVSYIAPDNQASIAVALRLGAVHEETIQLDRCGIHRVYRHPRPEGGFLKP